MVCGGFLQFLSFCLVAPVPLLARFVTPTTGTVIALQVLFGIGLSCSLLPSYNEMVRSTISNGTKESIMVYGIISAIFNSSYNAGEGIGPLLGGYIADKLNFEVYIVPIYLLFSQILFSVGRIHCFVHVFGCFCCYDYLLFVLFKSPEPAIGHNIGDGTK